MCVCQCPSHFRATTRPPAASVTHIPFRQRTQRKRTAHVQSHDSPTSCAPPPLLLLLLVVRGNRVRAGGTNAFPAVGRGEPFNVRGHLGRVLVGTPPDGLAYRTSGPFKSSTGPSPQPKRPGNGRGGCGCCVLCGQNCGPQSRLGQRSGLGGVELEAVPQQQPHVDVRTRVGSLLSDTPYPSCPGNTTRRGVITRTAGWFTPSGGCLPSRALLYEAGEYAAAALALRSAIEATPRSGTRLGSRCAGTPGPAASRPERAHATWTRPSRMLHCVACSADCIDAN